MQYVKELPEISYQGIDEHSVIELEVSGKVEPVPDDRKTELVAKPFRSGKIGVCNNPLMRGIKLGFHAPLHHHRFNIWLFIRPSSGNTSFATASSYDSLMVSLAI